MRAFRVAEPLDSSATVEAATPLGAGRAPAAQLAFGENDPDVVELGNEHHTCLTTETPHLTPPKPSSVQVAFDLSITTPVPDHADVCPGTSLAPGFAAAKDNPTTPASLVLDMLPFPLRNHLKAMTQASRARRAMQCRRLLYPLPPGPIPLEPSTTEALQA